MSSSYYRGEIQSCEAAISACRQKIQETQILISNQENEYLTFKGKRISFEESFQKKKKNKSIIGSVANEVTVASKLFSHMEKLFTGEQRQLERLENITKSMGEELDGSKALLLRLEKELQHLQQHLAGLNAEYSSALNHEAEEAAKVTNTRNNK